MAYLRRWLQHVLQWLHDCLNPRVTLFIICSTQHQTFWVCVHLKIVRLGAFNFRAKVAIQRDDAESFGGVFCESRLVSVVRQMICQNKIPVFPVFVASSTSSQLAEDTLQIKLVACDVQFISRHSSPACELELA